MIVTRRMLNFAQQKNNKQYIKVGRLHKTTIAWPCYLENTHCTKPDLKQESARVCWNATFCRLIWWVVQCNQLHRKSNPTRVVERQVRYSKKISFYGNDKNKGEFDGIGMCEHHANCKVELVELGKLNGCKQIVCGWTWMLDTLQQSQHTATYFERSRRWCLSLLLCIQSFTQGFFHTSNSVTV